MRKGKKSKKSRAIWRRCCDNSRKTGARGLARLGGGIREWEPKTGVGGGAERFWPDNLTVSTNLSLRSGGVQRRLALGGNGGEQGVESVVKRTG